MVITYSGVATDKHMIITTEGAAAKIHFNSKKNEYEYTINESAVNGWNRCPVPCVRRICKWYKRGNTVYGSLALLRETL